MDLTPFIDSPQTSFVSAEEWQYYSVNINIGSPYFGLEFLDGTRSTSGDTAGFYIRSGNVPSPLINDIYIKDPVAGDETMWVAPPVSTFFIGVFGGTSGFSFNYSIVIGSLFPLSLESL